MRFLGVRAVGLVFLSVACCVTIVLTASSLRTATAAQSPAPARQATARPTPKHAQDTLPNVVIYLIDTLRADRLNVYGYEGHETSPRMDKLAREGVLFENGTATAPWTLPSIVSLFTSSFPCEHQILSTYDRLPDSWDTLTEHLKGLGYRTFTQYQTGFLAQEFGLQQGFDYHRRQFIPNGASVDRVLGKPTPQPFFFYIHTVEPHNPYRFAPKHTPGFKDYSPAIRNRMHRDMRRYKKAGEYDYRARFPLGSNDLTDEQDAALVKLRELTDAWFELYDASVLFADRNVGSVIDLLKARGVWDNTLFILIADHGEEYDEHGGWLHDQSVYAELMHVPFIIRFPGDRYAGKRIREPVSLVDLLPTILDYVGRPELAENPRGRSLLPLIRGDIPDDYDRISVPGMRINTTRYYRPWEETRGRTNILVRKGPWKGIWNVELDNFELYNLDDDPKEQNDVHEQQSEITQALQSYARVWYESQRQLADPDGADEAGELSEDTRDALKALGYIADDEEEDE
jgi:arylsulfatase A-like enzyme